MSKFAPKTLAGTVAAVALATTAFTAVGSAPAQAATVTSMYSGGGTFAELIYRGLFNCYGLSDSGNLGAPGVGCASSPVNSLAEFYYLGVGSGNGKKAFTTYNPGNYVSGARTPDDPPSNGTFAHQYYGAGVGPSWVSSATSTNFFPAVTFSGSDDPLTSSDTSTYNANSLNTLYGAPVQFPTLIAAVALGFTPASGTWTPAGVEPTGGSSSVDLSLNTVCGIYTGHITDWSDSHITADNGGTALGAGTITVTYRSDSSGTTFLFSNALLHQCTTANGVDAADVTTLASWSGLSGNAPAGTGNNSFFINVQKDTTGVGPLPANFSNAAGSGGIQLLIDSTAGALGYIAPGFLEPVWPINNAGSKKDSHGNLVASEANPQTFASVAGGTPVWIAPTAAAASEIMADVTPPSFLKKSCSLTLGCASNPINWGVTQPAPSLADAYPYGGFTFIDTYQCHASSTVLADLIKNKTSTAPYKGLFGWFFDSPAYTGNPGFTILGNNGAAPIPAAWQTAVLTLLATSKMKLIKGPHTGTCTSGA